MKFELDTTNKTIILKENISFKELEEVIKKFSLEDYQIVPHTEYQSHWWTPQIYPVYQPTHTDWQITCNETTYCSNPSN